MNERANECDENENSGREGLRWDLGTLFPAKGDDRRPPEWFGRALLYVAIAVVLFSYCWRSWGSVAYLIYDILISLFLALAIEPMVKGLVVHGWNRVVAALLSFAVVIVAVCVLLLLFGNMFIQQVIALISGLPDMYEQARAFVDQRFSFNLPEINNLGPEILKNIQTSWVSDFAGQAMHTVSGVSAAFIDITTILMVTYYISAAGPKLRRSVCQWFAPSAQRRILTVWTVAQDQISSFLFSRTILAVLNAFFTGVFLVIMDVPYWLPLALFCGIVSQFIPMVGTFVGGAAPVLFAWGNNGLMAGIAVIVFITIYQQIENFIFLPKISQRTMDINEAVAFISVLFFGSLFGAIGAFLALPIAASIQVIVHAGTRRYELVDSPLMDDPAPKRKSKVVEAGEAFNEHVIQPINHAIPRAVKGTANRVHVDDEIRQMQEIFYSMSDEELREGMEDESATVAIPKHVLKSAASGAGNTGKPGKPVLKGVEADDGESAGSVGSAETDESAEPVKTDETDETDETSKSGSGPDVSSNPRKGWR